MTFVHGHARDHGWVVGHVRRPNRPEGEQLPLTAADAADAHGGGGAGEPVLPAPRPSPERRTGGGATPPDRAERGGAAAAGVSAARPAGPPAARG